MTTLAETLAALECKSCRWWLISKRTVTMGECRRMPPSFADNIEDPRVWPFTKRDDWCGEHSAIDQAIAQAGAAGGGES